MLKFATKASPLFSTADAQQRGGEEGEASPLIF